MEPTLLQTFRELMKDADAPGVALAACTAYDNPANPGGALSEACIEAGVSEGALIDHVACARFCQHLMCSHQCNPVQQQVCLMKACITVFWQLCIESTNIEHAVDNSHEGGD